MLLILSRPLVLNEFITALPAFDPFATSNARIHTARIRAFNGIKGTGQDRVM